MIPSRIVIQEELMVLRDFTLSIFIYQKMVLIHLGHLLQLKMQ